MVLSSCPFVSTLFEFPAPQPAPPPHPNGGAASHSTPPPFDPATLDLVPALVADVALPALQAAVARSWLPWRRPHASALAASLLDVADLLPHNHPALLSIQGEAIRRLRSAAASLPPPPAWPPVVDALSPRCNDHARRGVAKALALLSCCVVLRTPSHRGGGGAGAGAAPHAPSPLPDAPLRAIALETLLAKHVTPRLRALAAAAAALLSPAPPSPHAPPDAAALSAACARRFTRRAARAAALLPPEWLAHPAVGELAGVVRSFGMAAAAQLGGHAEREGVRRARDAVLARLGRAA